MTVTDEDAKRPLGRKTEKENRKRSRPENSMEKIIAQQDAVVKEMRRKREILEEIASEAIMSKDLSGMDDAQKQYYVYKRQKILTRMIGDDLTSPEL